MIALPRSLAATLIGAASLTGCSGYAELDVPQRAFGALDVAHEPRSNRGPGRVQLSWPKDRNGGGDAVVVGPPTALSAGARVISWAYGLCRQGSGQQGRQYLCAAVQWGGQVAEPVGFSVVIEDPHKRPTNHPYRPNASHRTDPMRHSRMPFIGVLIALWLLCSGADDDAERRHASIPLTSFSISLAGGLAIPIGDDSDRLDVGLHASLDATYRAFDRWGLWLQAHLARAPLADDLALEPGFPSGLATYGVTIGAFYEQPL